MNLSEKWLNPDHIRLCAGEIAPEEMRTVIAVLRAVFAEQEREEKETGPVLKSLRQNDGIFNTGECWTGKFIVNFDELEKAAERAKNLATGLNLSRTETRNGYGEEYQVSTTDWSSVAILLHLAASQKNS